jgi:hypothetical protein
VVSGISGDGRFCTSILDTGKIKQHIKMSSLNNTNSERRCYNYSNSVENIERGFPGVFQIAPISAVILVIHQSTASASNLIPHIYTCLHISRVLSDKNTPTGLRIAQEWKACQANPENRGHNDADPAALRGETSSRAKSQYITLVSHAM